MKLIVPEYINKESSNNPEARQEYISKFNENLKSKDSEVLCNTVLNVNFVVYKFIFFFKKRRLILFLGKFFNYGTSFWNY